MERHLTRLSAAELAEAIAEREVSAVEVAQAHLDRIADVDDRVHAFLHVDAERFEMGRDQRRGALLGVRQLRMLVNVMTPRGDLVGDGCRATIDLGG